MKNVFVLVAFLFSISCQAQFIARQGGVFRKPATTTSISYVNSANMGETTGTSKTYSFTVSSGTKRFLIVAFNGDNATGFDDITGVTYAGVSMTFLNKITNSGGRYHYMYYLANPTTGANNVVISCTNSHNLNGAVAQYNGVTGVDGNGTNNTGPTTSYSWSFTTTNNNAWVVVFEGGYNGGSPPDVGSGVTRRTYGATFGDYGLFDTNGPKTPAGSVSFSTTRTSTTGGQGRSYNVIALYP